MRNRTLYTYTSTKGYTPHNVIYKVCIHLIGVKKNISSHYLNAYMGETVYVFFGKVVSDKFILIGHLHTYIYVTFTVCSLS